MALPIKPVPILSGAIAEEFIRQAEENERHPWTPLSKEQEDEIAEIMRKSKEFIPSWKRN